MNKKIKFFIVASVILNVVLVGLVMGHMTHRYGLGMQQAIDALPPEKQEEFKAAMKKVHGEKVSGWQDVKASREKIADILTAPVFDKAAYDAEVRKMRSLRSAKGQQMADAIAKLAATWSQEQRRALAEALRRKPHHYRAQHDSTKEK